MQRCKYCGSEMDLMEDDNDYLNYVCLNEECNWTLTIREGWMEEWEEIDKS